MADKNIIPKTISLSIKIPFSKKSVKPKEGDIIAIDKNGKAKVMEFDKKFNKKSQIGFFSNGKIVSKGVLIPND